ncbi:MAG: 4Fe-4S dicluster domain-containing protein [Syntrophaceae bacterium]|nr:4Fe-4S dicluster domain-containing protein [Syntrophaceae bacterium]
MKTAQIRVVISLIVFVLFLLLFLGGENISVFLSSILLPLQFVPALIHTVNNPSVLFISGLIFIVVISLIFGRVYCSFLCPLGTLQDIVIALARKTGFRKIHAFRKPNNWLRYSILATTSVFVALGSMSLLNLLDPYSLIGRIFTSFIQPTFVQIENAGINVLKNFNIYFFHADTAYLPVPVFFITLVSLIIILIMSARWGRFYCNTVCPVGTLLGLMARIAVFKFVFNQTNCRECISCESVCKAGCIDHKTATIDQSRCVGCFNCLEACPQANISYMRCRGNIHGGRWSPSRRGFLIGTIAATATGLFAFIPGLRNLLGTAHASENPPITPPGSVGINHFTRACTACHLCVSACPTKVITPSFSEYGISGMLQPRMNYEKSFCDYECNVCGRVCPSGAILPLPLAEKKYTQIGVVELLKDKCIVYVNKKNCGACGEVCPTHTIIFINKENILYPEVDTRYCIGCGACEKSCPTTPKSIVVRSNPIHKKADKFAGEEIPVKKDKEKNKDFPF